MEIQKPLPFRRLNQLKILLKANALLRGADRVEEVDFEWFQSIVNWLNFTSNAL